MTTLGKLWTGAVAYVSLIVGAGLSIAGNLADTYRTRGAATDTLDQVLAAGWPVLVLLAIHMFVSPRWSSAILFQTWRWVGVLSIGGMAMIVSWTHLHALLVSRGQLDIVSVLGPLAIDGMAIMATGLILSTRTGGQQDIEQDSKASSNGRRTGQPDIKTLLSESSIGQDSGQLDRTADNWTGHEGDTPTGVLSRTDVQWAHRQDCPAEPHGHWTGDWTAAGTGQDTAWTPDSPADKLTELSSEEREWLASATQPLPPETLPIRVRAGSLSEDQRAEARLLLAIGRKEAHLTPVQARTLLAAWYGVSTKTIQRAERG